MASRKITTKMPKPNFFISPVDFHVLLAAYRVNLAEALG